MASLTSSLPRNPVFVSQSSKTIKSCPRTSFHPLQRPRHYSNPRRHFAARANPDEVSVLDPPPQESSFVGGASKSELASLKLKLLSAVSGLNKGLAANEEDLQKADAAAKEVEAAGGPVDLFSDVDKLQGRWKLVYSSAFSSRTLGGNPPGPPTRRLLPITLGQAMFGLRNTQGNGGKGLPKD